MQEIKFDNHNLNFTNKKCTVNVLFANKNCVYLLLYFLEFAVILLTIKVVEKISIMNT